MLAALKNKSVELSEREKELRMRLEQANQIASKADAERLRLQSQLKPVPTKLMRPSITSEMFKPPVSDESGDEAPEENFFDEPRSLRGTYKFQTKRETRNASVSVKRQEVIQERKFRQSIKGTSAMALVEPPELFDQLKKKMLIKHITADQLFTWMDQKKRNRITFPMFKAGLQRMQMHYSDTELRALFRALDPEGKRSLTYLNFCQLFKSVEKTRRESLKQQRLPLPDQSKSPPEDQTQSPKEESSSMESLKDQLGYV